MGRLQEEQLSLDNKCFKKGRIYPLLFYYIFSMRKILAVVSLFALGVSAAFAAEPTDLDSLFRGHEYKPVLNASLRDSADSQQSAAVLRQIPSPASLTVTICCSSKLLLTLMRLSVVVPSFPLARVMQSRLYSILRSTSFVAVDGLLRKPLKIRLANFLPIISMRL